MGDLSKHFDRDEFKCRCGSCDQDQVDHELILVLERLREYVRAPITITSGNRCPKWNTIQGGATRSKHLFSIAADIKVKGWSPSKIYDLLDAEYPDMYGLKEYSSWVHIDIRKKKWRGKRP